MAGSAWFKRKGGLIDLRTAELSDLTCPHCDGPATSDYVDLVQQKSLHTCRRCGRFWESWVATTEHASR
jgi:transcription elongation factor Elf1